MISENIFVCVIQNSSNNKNSDIGFISFYEAGGYPTNSILIIILE